MQLGTRVMQQSTPNLDSLSQRFLTELERVVPRDSFRKEFTDRLIVTITARDSEVGDITVWLDGDEVTVGIGKLHHSHFEVYTQRAELLDEREQAAAENATGYIRDLLDDRIHIQVQYELGRCKGSCSWYPEHADRPRLIAGVDEVREYVWSHRIS